ncbi:MAG TPA: right-handed parallel beta-helix repeat-containing protein, partial [Egibacteraceae bacterium]|nr:right-handed parallel beta-helix repeat-containing protein [Egibacteraceae bacterium]
FRSVSADGGANAILFDPANGSDGASLSVTGSTADGSGGVIRASSGDAVVVGGGSVSLARMRVEDGAGRAIAADGAASVSLTRVTLSGNGGAGGLPTVDLAETTGAVTIMSSTLSAGSGDLLRVAASATTPTVTVYQSTFSDGDGAGLLVEADADGAVSATVSGSTFDGLAGPGVRWRAGLSPGADGHSLLTVVSSAFRDRAGAGGSHLALELGASSATTAVLGAAGQPNTFDTVGGTGAAAIQLDVSGGAVLEATVAASTIDAPRGRGLALEAAQAADVTLLVDANTIRDAVAEALWAAAGAGDGDSAVDVTVTANQVSGANAGAAALAAIAVESAEHTLCADVSGNTVTATAGGAFDVVLRAVDPGLLRYAMAGSGTVTDADVVARNTIGAAQVTGAGVSGSGGAACRLP